MSKKRIFCSTISYVDLVEGNLHIYFMDGSIRKYEGLEDLYKKMLEINGKKSVGSFYRITIREAGLPYEEIQKATNILPVNK